VSRQFLRFSAVGVAGFAIDALILYFAIHQLGAGLYLGRLVSYITAATSTWALNRRYTFQAKQDRKMAREWMKFLAANAVGGLINYAVYVMLVNGSELVAAWPVIGVAAGSIAGLIANFSLSRRFVFSRG
jgi:putative flippase GtrA